MRLELFTMQLLIDELRTMARDPAVGAAARSLGELHTNLEQAVAEVSEVVKLLKCARHIPEPAGSTPGESAGASP